MSDQPAGGRTPDEPDDVVVPDDLSSLLDGPAGSSVPDDASSLLDDTADRTVPDDASALLGSDGDERSATAGTPTGDGASAADAADDRDAADDAAARDDADAAPVVVPDDLSSLAAGGTEVPSLALVVTQVAAPAPLAAACALAKVDVDVVPSSVGAIAVLCDPASGAAGAEAISRLLRTLPVILLERREGQISAGRWTGGARVADLPPGLVLSDAPSVLEDLLLGDAKVAEVPGVVSSVGMSRWQAMRALAAGRKSR
ncbi:hypothetical protein ACFO3K_15755 [Cellulomonas algicola]|uniref:hypothetical protein n=1 Tax=Cellulomonas algicola TaxID=2071633 RepID=UPI001CED8AA9|nr:hypothetical protein [Cellulomonas algicola]